MDADLRALQRAVAMHPHDAAARAALCIAERRQGHGIGQDVQPDALRHVLTAQWVSRPEWAAVRSGFRSVTLVRPGNIYQVIGYQSWFGRRGSMAMPPQGPALIEGGTFALAGVNTGTLPTECLVGRRPDQLGRPAPHGYRGNQQANRDSEDVLNGWLSNLVRWTEGNCSTVVTRRGIEYAVANEDLTVYRFKETWPLEHVRLHCGIDPVEPQAPTEPELAAPRIGTCNKCRATEGREREDKDILCYDCWRTK